MSDEWKHIPKKHQEEIFDWFDKLGHDILLIHGTNKEMREQYKKLLAYCTKAWV